MKTGRSNLVLSEEKKGSLKLSDDYQRIAGKNKIRNYEYHSCNAQVDPNLQTFRKYRGEMSKPTAMDKTGGTANRSIRI